jgi:thiamine kinase-like enzyme
MQLDEWSEYELLVACDGAPVIYKAEDWGNEVRRISQSMVVKIMSSNDREYLNQIMVHRELQGTIVKIPEPFRFIVHGHTGYFFMEFIEGLTLEKLFETQPQLRDATLDKVRLALKCLHGIERDRPGPLVDGHYTPGFPWGLRTVKIRSADELQVRVDQRLERLEQRRKLGWTMKLPGAPYSLCHMDLNLRNIILTTNNEIALIDWSTATFYPKKFELAMLSVSKQQYLLTDEDTSDDLDLNKLRAVEAMSTCSFL